MKRSLAVLTIAWLLGGCEAFRSDAENYARRDRAERAERLEGMRAATSQAPAGERVSGDALVALVSGRTHVFVYSTAPGGRAVRYVEQSYFADGGRFVYVNTEWAKDPAGREGDRWHVDGERLCILNQTFSSQEQCYRLTVLADGRVQYFISKPGDETDGLVTKVTDAIRDAPPALE